MGSMLPLKVARASYTAANASASLAACERQSHAVVVRNDPVILETVGGQPRDALDTVLREPRAALQFGAFKLFPRRRRLIQDDDEVRIGSRAFDLLTVLAMHAGEILSHAELIGAVWPNRVVSDGNLKTQIGALQKILGQTSCGDRHIKCVALRGYVFVADVHLV